MYKQVLAGVGSIAWWLRWQIGQASGEEVAGRGHTPPSVVPITSARSAIGSTMRQIRFCSDTFEGHLTDPEYSVPSVVQSSTLEHLAPGTHWMAIGLLGFSTPPLVWISAARSMI